MWFKKASDEQLAFLDELQKIAVAGKVLSALGHFVTGTEEGKRELKKMLPKGWASTHQQPHR